jgi:hypothetical protein
VKGFGTVVVAVLLAAIPARADEPPVSLKEAFTPGYRYHVSCRVEVSGKLQLPPDKGQTTGKTLGVTGTSAIEYDERILALAPDKKVHKTIRQYGRMEFDRKVGDQLQQNRLRPEVRRLVVLRRNQVEVPFAPAGPLTWGEIDMVRTDVFTPALAGLLPDQPVRPGQAWQAHASALQELTDLERLDEGSLTCRLESVFRLANRRQARVSFQGKVRGMGEDGTARHELDGFFFFDLESNHLSYLSMKGAQSLLDKDGKAAGTIEGTFVLTRQPNTPCKELDDEALRGLTLEPNDDNTRLLFDDPDLGVRFLYPRRWRVAGSNGRQIGLDEPGGGGILMTVEALPRVPSPAQYLQESRTFLAQQKATLFSVDNPRSLDGPPHNLDYFSIDASVGGGTVASQRIRLDYYVLRQQLGGATLAARLLPRDLEALRREVLAIARSVRITRQQAAENRGTDRGR